MKIPLKHIVLCFLISLIESCNGQQFGLGACRANLASTTTPAGLTMANLVGTWRETARSKYYHFHGWRCVTYTITEITANRRYNVVISGRKKGKNAPVTISGIIDVGGVITGNSATATTFLNFILGYQGGTKTLKYFITSLNDALANTLVLYACQDVAFGRIQSATLLTKATSTAASIDAGLQALSGVGFPIKKLSFNYQRDCSNGIVQPVPVQPPIND